MAIQQPTHPKLTNPKPKSFFRSPSLPIIVIVVVFGIALLQITGIIQLPHIGGPIVNEIQPPATIGVASAYDFEELISMLNPDYNGDRSAYTFYLGSGVGFPPMGMILGTDGILQGTPTGTGRWCSRPRRRPSLSDRHQRDPRHKADERCQ